jgi:dTDP-glucose pyrophosphorylase
MGSRFGGLKQLAPVGPNGEALLEYSLHDAKLAGFSRALIVIRESFEATFRDEVLPRLAERMPVSYALQDTTNVFERAGTLPGGLWGTGHAVLVAGRQIEGTFAVVNADDFYGRSAYVAAAERLGELDGGRYVLVSYAVGDTLSPNGPVSRGICELDGVNLRSIVEHTKLERDNGGVISHTHSSQRFSLETPVSMNFWGFTPDVLDRLKPLMEAFALDASTAPGSELRLPDAVGELLSSGEVSVEVLPAGKTWFGMTYSADLDAARQSLARLIEEGSYPEQLGA